MLKRRFVMLWALLILGGDTMLSANGIFLQSPAGTLTTPRATLISGGWGVEQLTVPDDEWVVLHAVAYDAAWDPPYRGLAWNVNPSDPTEIYTSLYKSEDGRIWTRDQIVFNLSPDKYSFVKSMVWDSINTRWMMQYAGPQGGGGEKIGLAHSTDLISWNDLGYVLTPGVSPAPPTSTGLFGSGIILVGSTYYMLIDEAYDMSLVHIMAFYSSSDLSSWTREGAVLQESAGEWDAGGIFQGHVVYSEGDNKYVIYYTGSNAGATERSIGIAYANSITGPYTKFAGNPVVQASNIFYGEPFLFYDTPSGEFLLYLRRATAPAFEWRSWLATR